MTEDFYKLKQDAIDLLRKRMTEDVRKRLAEVDDRLLEYFDDCATNVSNVFGDENDRHGMWELLCGCKFLRMFSTYHFNAKKVQFYLRLREGIWRRDGNRWTYVSGGLRLPSIQGARIYRWQPFQVFVLASVFGFYTWINTKVEAGTKDVLEETEREKDGWVWDFRRFVAEFIMYGPRKIDKTGLSSFIQLVFFLFGDFNSEIYALAMTEAQSKILFDRTKFMLNQANVSDEGNPMFRMTQKIVDWLPKYREQIRNSKIVPLTGGGKAPDGTNTQLLNWDELGSSPYVNGKSDMQAHINVCQSSMGMRREPLTFGTTTAGTITTGPFIDMLQGRHDLLLDEFKYEMGEAEPSLMYDSQMCLLLEPDEYEKQDEEYIITSHALRRKINPMLGVIVQYDFYDREMAKARQDGEQKFAECVSKLFNVYRSQRVHEWIRPEVIRLLQNDKTIDAYTGAGGWVIFTGLDFSQGDDLHTAGYLAARKHHSGSGYELFADFDAWVKQDVLEKSSIRPLYEEWIAKGWLHVSPGAVFQPSLFVKRFDELLMKGCQFQYFGYDPYQSKDPINTLKAYLQEKGVAQPDKYVLPVSQRNAWFNAPTDDLARAIKSPIPYITFSANPMWPWLFGNCVLSIDGKGGASADMDLGNKKPVKRTSSDSCKVDPVQAIIMGMGLMVQYESQNH